MILTEQDFERCVEGRVGDTITVRLTENPSTGYRWAVEAASGLAQIGDRFQANCQVGAAGAREIEFQISRPGALELRLRKWREWAGEGSVIARFNVRITAT